MCVCVQSVECEMRGMCVRCCSTHLPRKFCKLSNIQSINNIASFGSNFTCCSRRGLLLVPLSPLHFYTVTVSLYHSFSRSHLGAYSLCTSHFITLLNYVLTLFLLLYLTLTFVNCWLTFSWIFSSTTFSTRSVSLRLRFTSHFTTHTERQHTAFDRVVVPTSAISRSLNRSACATHNFKLCCPQSTSSSPSRRSLQSTVVACVRFAKPNEQQVRTVLSN